MIIIAVPMTFIAYLTIGYAIGQAGYKLGEAYNWTMAMHMMTYNGIYLMNTRPDNSGYCWIMFIVGVLVCILLSVLPRKFTGLAEWISPGAILLVYLGGWLFWFPFLIAWIVKYYTVRVGGAAYVQKYLIPLAVGIFIGSAILYGLVIIYYFAQLLPKIYIR